MTVETTVHRAHERVRRERERTVEKRRRFEQFEATVAELETSRPGVQRGGAGGTAGAGAWTATTSASTASGGATTSTSTNAVLDAFETHLAEHSGDALTDPDTVPEAVAEEFSMDLATALCGSSTAGVLTPALKAAVLEETRSRTGELDVTAAALEAEDDSLEACLDALDAVIDWFVANNPTPLSELGFEELRRWHERIEEHRASLDRAARERQSHLHESTTRAGAVGVEHDALLEYLYADVDDAHPALATIARLDEACHSAQRALRSHLVRRI